jgi:hypothetical protein
VLVCAAFLFSLERGLAPFVCRAVLVICRSSAGLGLGVVIGVTCVSHVNIPSLGLCSFTS